MQIILFFTYGVSLKLWHDAGMLDRELLIYKKLVKNGHKITFFTYGGGEDLQFKKSLGDIAVVPVYTRVKRFDSRILRFLLSFTFPFIFKDLFKSADIFKTNQMLGSWVPVIGKILYRKKLVIRCGYELLRNHLRNNTNSVRGILKAIFYCIMEVVAYRIADRIIMSCETNIKFVRERLGVARTKVTLIRNFVDTESFSPNNEMRRKLVLNNNLLYAGRLIKEKNLKSLLLALKDLKIQLDIIGGGDQKQELEESARKLDTSVNFLGIFPNSALPKLINNYSFCILPSLYENSPKTLLEAMACGRVVIGTNVEGIKELISEGENGLLCKPDSNSINYTIKKAMNLTVSEREKMGANARKFVSKECNLERIYYKEKNLYEQIISP